MLNIDESELLLQIVESMHEHVSKFEIAYKKGDFFRAQEIKKFILKLQKQINQLVEIKNPNHSKLGGIF